MSTSVNANHIPDPGTKRPTGSSNWVAKLVLVPTVPMLMASIAALALFYLAPVRFGALLARLPGETFLRTALVFAPATLFAVVVLAFLYAIDGGKPEVRERRREVSPASRGRTTAWVLLAPTIPALLVSTALWALSFISPVRLDRLLEPLPGTSYLRRLIPFLPPALFLLTFMLLIYLFLIQPREAEKDEREFGGVHRFANLMVLGTFVAALVALAFAAIALGSYYIRPELFLSLVSRIPFEELVRIAIMFAPAVLLALVLLALLFLRKENSNGQPVDVEPDATAAGVHVREKAATLVLVAGLSFSVVAAIGIVGTILYLLIR